MGRSPSAARSGNAPGTLRLLIALCCALSTLASLGGCTRKQADALRPSRDEALPAALLALPGKPVALAYLRSPAGLCKEWFAAARQRLGEDSELLAVLDRCLTGSGPGVLAGWEGTTAIGCYPPAGPGQPPAFFVRVLGGSPEKLDPWVAGMFPGSPSRARVVAGAELQRTLGPGGEWYHGRLRGDWILTNSAELLGSEPLLAKTLAPGLRECWNACGERSPDALLAVDLSALASDTPFLRSQLEALGLANADLLMAAFRQQEGRCVDGFFLHTPAPHRGVLAIAGRETLTEDVLAGIAEESIGFSVMSIDLAGLWDQLQGIIPEPARRQLVAFEQNLGFWLRQDLLASLGNQWVTNTFPHPSSPHGMATILRIPVENGQKLRSCLQRLLAGAGAPPWKSGPDGFELLTLPVPVPGAAGPPVLAAARSGDWYLASSESALEVWNSDLMHQGGHAGPRDLLQRYARRATWLGWTSRHALTRSKEAWSQAASMLGHSPVAPLAGLLPVEAMVGELDSFVGDSLFAVVPMSKGILAELESDCGLLPVVLCAGAGAIVMQQQQGELAALDLVRRQVAEAQERFMLLHGRYASNLWELQDAGLLSGEVASGITAGHLYRISTHDSTWQLEFRRETDRTVFQVVNESGFLRRVDG